MEEIIASRESDHACEMCIKAIFGSGSSIGKKPSTASKSGSCDSFKIISLYIGEIFSISWIFVHEALFRAMNVVPGGAWAKFNFDARLIMEDITRGLLNIMESAGTSDGVSCFFRFFLALFDIIFLESAC